MGTWERAPPWRLRFFSLYVETSCLVWFGTMPHSKSPLGYLFSRIRFGMISLPGIMVRVQKLTLFYRATLCVIARSLLSSGVRPSVCPSRSCIVSRWLKISSNIFLGPVASRFQFFWPQLLILNFKENPFGWGAKYTGVGKFAIFDWNRRLSRKRYKIGPYSCHGML